MATIIAGGDAIVTVNLLQNGKPYPATGPIKAAIYPMNGKTALYGEVDVPDDVQGADWPAGVVAVEIPGSATASLASGDYLLVLTGPAMIKRSRLTVETLFLPTRNSLFIRDIVVDEIRTDQLMAAAASVLSGVEVSDDYIWGKVRAAESEISHTLGVPLVPTRFFSVEPPTQEQIDALDGMAWEVEPAYDYAPDLFRGDRWGLLVTRQRPIIDIISFSFTYPSSKDSYMPIPLDWIRWDAKYGSLNLVPSSPAIFAQMDAIIMTALTGGRAIPQMMRLDYTAGLQDVPNQYPELIDVIKKLAVLKIVADSYLPQSGSISADGLSQSLSVDMGKYQEVIDHTLNGPDGSNGGLMRKLHGIRMLVM